MYKWLVVATSVVSLLCANARADWLVSISAPRTAISIGEPLLITVSVKNTGTQAATLPRDLSLEYGNVTIEVAGGGEPEYRRVFPRVSLEPSLQLLTLAPGQADVLDLVFLTGLEHSELVFPKAGGYTVKVGVQPDLDEADVVTSNVLSVTVLDPVGVTNKDAFVVVKSRLCLAALSGLKLEDAVRSAMQDLANGTSISCSSTTMRCRSASMIAA